MIFTIAEIGQAHEGSLGIAHSYIDAISKTGCSAIKFQTHIADAESSIHEPFRIQFSKQDKTRFDYWKRMEFSLQEWKDLKQHCDDVDLEFISSPFSNAAVDLLEEVGVKRYKIGSGEVNNFLLLEKIAQTKKPIILSSGMSSYAEIDNAVDFLKSKDVEFSILQCTTAYPTQPKEYGLNLIQEFRERYKVKVGYSDHSSSTATLIAAAALGAEILEFHAVFDKNMFGPDANSSLTISEINNLVSDIHKIDLALSHPVNKNNIDKFLSLKNIFEKSLAVNKDLSQGHIITFDDLEAKKPKGFGIDAKDFKEIIGKEVIVSKKKWDFLNYEDLQ